MLRIAAALLVAASIATQVVDETINGDFAWYEYYSYFTIQSSLINVGVLLIAGWSALRRADESELVTSLRMAVTGYAVVTAIVYAALLRGVVSDGFVGIPWPNEVIHVIVPVYLVVDWLVAPGRTPLSWRRLWFVAAYPLAWVAFTIIRGLLTTWYPYPFLEPDGPAGWGGVSLYILAIAGFIVGMGALAIGISRWTRPAAAVLLRRAPLTGSPPR